MRCDFRTYRECACHPDRCAVQEATHLGTMIGTNHPIRRLQSDARWTIAGFTAMAIITALIIFAGSVVGPVAV